MILGVFDLPAQIDYILEKTKQNQLSLIGHSQGATVGFVLLSELPEYNDKIRIFHAMAPPVILKYYSLSLAPILNSLGVLKVCVK